MVIRRAERALREWTPVFKRIIIARFYSRFRRLSVIQAYAPHNEREKEEKNLFYEELQQTIDECNRDDILVVMSDFIAKVGGDNEEYESCMQIHEMEAKNHNAERLCDFAVVAGLVITGTLFQHKDIHKATWVSANRRVKNQIDHLLISRKSRCAVLDDRVQKGADINSDHYLVRIRIRLSLTKYVNVRRIEQRK